MRSGLDPDQSIEVQPFMPHSVQPRLSHCRPSVVNRFGYEPAIWMFSDRANRKYSFESPPISLLERTDINIIQSPILVFAPGESAVSEVKDILVTLFGVERDNQ